VLRAEHRGGARRARNTRAQRIRRAEQLLGVSLSLPDERLTLQLACRALRLRAGSS
jgi:DNA-binding PucR family transcriptional regulator